jgi:hypothetical protein
MGLVGRDKDVIRSSYILPRRKVRTTLFSRPAGESEMTTLLNTAAAGALAATGTTAPAGLG